MTGSGRGAIGIAAGTADAEVIDSIDVADAVAELYAVRMLVVAGKPGSLFVVIHVAESAAAGSAAARESPAAVDIDHEPAEDSAVD
jgi:hypothetical protein